jgi:hypothetical protein
MKFGGRLKYYLVGFSIGIIACLIIFKGRGCEWLPNERVLNSIRTSNIYFTAQDSCMMASNNITKKDIFLLLANGDVDFSESNTERKIQPYVLDHLEQKAELKHYVIEYEGLKVSFNLYERDSVVFISKFNDLETSKNCSGESDIAKSMYLPNDMTLEKLSSNKLRFEKVFKCEMDCYGITDTDIDSLFIDGQVLFNHSYPNKKPNPLYFIEKEINDVTFIFWIEQGATKTRLNRIAKLKEDTDKNKTYTVEYLFSENPNCNCD